MSRCEQCGRDNPDWAGFCVACGRQIGPGPDDALAERGHVEYVIAQVPLWRTHGIVPPGSAARLLRMYRERLQVLGAAGTASAPADSTPVERSAEPTREDGPAVATLTPTTEATASGGVTELLEAHWLKLLAALAAAFIFAGMRQVLGWDWVNQLATALIPAAPLVLAAALIRWGVREETRDSVGARTCCGVGVVLVAFAVGSINKHWLGGVVPLHWSHCLAGAVGAGVARLVMAWTGHALYRHYILAGLMVAVSAASYGLSILLGPPAGDAWHVGIGLAATGAAYLWGAVASARRPADLAAPVYRLWGALACASACATGLLQVAIGPEAVAGPVVVIASSALALGAAARVLASPELAAGSVSALALAGVALLGRMPGVGVVDWGFLAAALGCIWAGAGLRRQSAAGEGAATDPADRAPAAFRYAALAAFVVAGGTVALRAADAVAGGQALHGDDWASTVGLALLCGAAYALVALWTRAAEVMAASAGMIGLSLGVITARAAQGSPWQTRDHLDLETAVPAVGLLMIARALDAMPRDTASGDDGQRRPDWGAPWALLGVAVALCAVIVAVAHALDLGVDRRAWTALAAVSAACALYAARMRRSGDVVAQASAGVSMVGATAIAAVGANEWKGAEGEYAALLGCAWLWLLTASVVANQGAARWCAALRVSGAVAVGSAVLGDRLVYGADGGYTLLLLSAIAAPVFALTSAVRRPPDAGLVLASVVPLVLGWTEAAIRGMPGETSLGVLVLATLAGSVAYGRAETRGLTGAGWLAGASVLLAWGGALRWLGWERAGWTGTAMLIAPAALLAIGYVAGLVAALGSTLRQCGVIGVALVVAWVESHRIASPWQGDAWTCATVALSAALLVWPLARSRTRAWAWSVGALSSLAAAHGTACAGLQGAHAALAFAGWAFVLAAVAAPLRARKAWAEAADGLTSVASVHAGLALAAGLAGAGAPGMGLAAVLTVVTAGSLWAWLYVLTRRPSYPHMAAAAFLIAHGLFVFDHIDMHAGVLDLYLIPLGVYLVVLGHFSDRRGRADEAQALWWTGLLTVVGPTFTAFWTNFASGGTSLHALLLVVECVGAVTWGVMRRIRAYVVIGVGFAVAFAAVVGAATVKHVWVGSIALAAGLAMLATVYCLSTRGPEAREWLRRATTEWRAWR